MMMKKMTVEPWNIKNHWLHVHLEKRGVKDSEITTLSSSESMFNVWLFIWGKIYIFIFHVTLHK